MPSAPTHVRCYEGISAMRSAPTHVGGYGLWSRGCGARFREGVAPFDHIRTDPIHGIVADVSPL
jgi:hypothetical protein